ncbi:16S rRNA (uracil(1498)-N(3))-methyltransferase [Corynebacterium caspium]|uniref:16S rRNA (uracil(1498)-N(3))-methyltransferase n=1 Tax=Corynebacterium caspium TaxID=234828 RepID=UPI0003747CA9|nr:16S rRNA (uracil(1498)-N(3))-methyltransferase [Corynebacterium caspium]WKD58893.1 Ribosomal RNA small subunit methyltransferase E [Corynebacterium caspium DSM 44850]
MSLPVFLHPDLSTATIGSVVELAGPEARHAITVKRLGIGSEIELVDAQLNRRIRAMISHTAGKAALQAEVLGISDEIPADPRVSIVQAIPKAERSELAIDLGTQAGADAFIAWQSQRTVAKWTAGTKAEKGIAKWQTQAAQSAKQARRATIPAVSGPLNTAQVVQWLEKERAENLAAGQNLQILVLHEAGATALKDTPVIQSGHIVLLIGPEGGISPEEITQLEAVGAQIVVLGPEVLRTASASMVALAALGMVTPRW